MFTGGYDLRIYSGIVTKITYSCDYNGRSDVCNRAYAIAIAENILCCSEYRFQCNGFHPTMCTGLFYTGAVIDLRTTNAEKSHFLSETLVGQIGYEVLRREKINGTAIGQFESVVLIDSSLSVVPLHSPR